MHSRAEGKRQFEFGARRSLGIYAVGRLFEPSRNLCQVKSLELIRIETGKPNTASFRAPDSETTWRRQKRPAIRIERQPGPFRLMLECQRHHVAYGALASMMRPDEALSLRGMKRRKCSPVPRCWAARALKLLTNAGKVRSWHEVRFLRSGTSRPAWLLRRFPLSFQGPRKQPSH